MGASSINFRKRSDLHLTRKLWHICGGLTILSVYWLFELKPKEASILLLTGAFAGFLTDFFRFRVKTFNKIIMFILSPVMRESEKDKWSGLPFYGLGLGINFLLFPEKIAILSALFLIFSDPFSSLVGIKFGRTKILPNKSLEGCMAGFLISMIISVSYLNFMGVVSSEIFIFSLFAGIISSFSEVLSALDIDDNLTIPVFSGLGVLVLNNYFQLLPMI